jgi:hypothetical protein
MLSYKDAEGIEHGKSLLIYVGAKEQRAPLQLVLLSAVTLRSTFFDEGT